MNFVTESLKQALKKWKREREGKQYAMAMGKVDMGILNICFSSLYAHF